MLAFSPTLLAVLSLSSAQMAMLISIVGLIFGCGVAFAGMYFQHQKQRLWHETSRIALEKGQPLPPPESEGFRHRDHTSAVQHDVRGGLVMIAVGVGLNIFLGAVGGENVARLGVIPGLIGVALLINAAFMGIVKGKGQDVPTPKV